MQHIFRPFEFKFVYYNRDEKKILVRQPASHPGYKAYLLTYPTCSHIHCHAVLKQEMDKHKVRRTPVSKISCKISLFFVLGFPLIRTKEASSNHERQTQTESTLKYVDRGVCIFLYITSDNLNTASELLNLYSLYYFLHETQEHKLSLKISWC